MANLFSKQETILFEKVVEKFQNSNMFAKNVDQFQPPVGLVERAGFLTRFVVPFQGQTSTGLDVSSDFKDQTELTIQIALALSDIKNAAFTMSANDRNDNSRLDRIASAETIKLSSTLDSHIKQTIVNGGALVAASTGDLASYADLAPGDTLLNEVEAPMDSARSMFVPPRTATAIANELGSRQTLDGVPLTAYERAVLPPIAGFNTFKTNVTTLVAVSPEDTVTVNGADQDVTPLAWDSGSSPGAGEVDDWRFQSLITASTTPLADADAFTIVGVNRVGMDTKEDTGQLMTFRVISGGGGDTVVISPAIIAAGAYQNVSAVPANGAAITAINTVASNPVVFMDNSSVVLLKSELDTEQLGTNVQVMSATTDSGVTILFARQGEIDDLSAKFRLTIWNRAHVVDPLKCGIILDNQTAAI